MQGNACHRHVAPVSMSKAWHGKCEQCQIALQEDNSIAAVLQRDAWLAFRVLCRLSMRTADSAAGMDPPALRGKVSTACISRHGRPVPAALHRVCLQHARCQGW